MPGDDVDSVSFEDRARVFGFEVTYDSSINGNLQRKGNQTYAYYPSRG